MTADDPYHLARFVEAQGAGGAFEHALDELRRGLKTSHWMWFVFPQIAGLGHSEMSRHYAISSLDEARAYLAHPILGPRLVASAAVLATGTQARAEGVLGELDALKLRSSMTLFARATPDESVFQQVLDLQFAGQADPATDRLV